MINKQLLFTLFIIICGITLVQGGATSDFEPMEFQDSMEVPADPDHWVWQLHHAFMLAEKNLFDAEFILDMKDKINLTAEQEQKMENIMMNYQETCLRIGAEIKIRELRLASAIKSEQLNKAGMAQYIREISQQKTDWVVKYFNYLLDLRDLLSKKQLSILATLSKEKSKRKPEQTPPPQNPK